MKNFLTLIIEKNGIYIPSGPDIKMKDVKYIATTINDFLSN